MATCPSGHASEDDEFCDVCGLAIGSAAETVPLPVASACKACGSPMDGRFCEACGADSLASAATQPLSVAKPVEWTAVISADRAYFDAVQAAEGPDAKSVQFPAYCPDRFFPLHGNQISIGRRSASRGIVPDIDLTGPPEDPGVSRLHAVLVAAGDGWSIVDLGSANGTTVNEDSAPLLANVPRPLSAGDRVHLGAWTTITLRAH
ncbi:FHA domain-containing protein [Fodinicola acaciae]|uniref:FHA domain-containing protein n=1 Tax=Fodinicola acaciae TaxID=2681555 RepID=UPI0013D67DA7|nr:FHA domain-containing protein [Fodinicola acaciae]